MNGEIRQPSSMGWTECGAVIGVSHKKIESLFIHHSLDFFPAFGIFGSGDG